MLRTYQTKIKTNNTQYLDEAASFFGFLERKLFVLLYVNKLNKNQCKKAFMFKHHITSRQYNAVVFILEGKVKSVLEKNKYDRKQLDEKMRSIHRNLKSKITMQQNMKDKIKEFKDQKDEKFRKFINQYQRLKFKIHQKKRKLKRLEDRQRKLMNDLNENKIRICFGGRPLFKKQFNLPENNYKDFSEWKKEWIETRNKTFYCIGSKDECGGNQSCTYTPSNHQLRLRVADQYCEEYGKYIVFENIKFPYGQEEINRSLETYLGKTKGKQVVKKYCMSPISYRFIKKEKGWYLYASVHVNVPDIKTSNRLGGIGIDLNAGFVCLCEIDRFGNPIGSKRIPMTCFNRRSEQVEAEIGDVVKEVVNQGLITGKPLVIEHLDFNKKKATLGEQGKIYARMLSGFTYKAFSDRLKRRAEKYGVEVIEVNPAYTSVIGQVKYMKRYGLSSHASAACVIARRGLKFKLDKPVNLPNLFNHKSNEKTRYKQWGAISKAMKAYSFKKRIEYLLTS